jgi:hypothetical protein
VKIYLVAVEALMKNERQYETQFTTKIDGFLSFIPRWMLVCILQLFLQVFFLNLTLCMTKLRVLVVLCFSSFTRITLGPRTWFWKP